MHLAVYSLFLATFCIGTTMGAVAGMLPQMAGDLQVDIPTAGYLATGYALGAAVFGPGMTLLTTRFPRRTTIIVLLILFVLGHVAAALAPNYAVLFAARVVSAIAHGSFFGVAIVVAASLAPEGRKGQAISIVFLGITVANLVGTPVGTYIGAALGWRTTFWILAGVAAAATIANALLVPADKAGDRRAISVGAQFRALGNTKALSTFALCFLTWGSLWCTLTYVAPLLIGPGGFTQELVTGALFAYGAGATIGVFAGGRLADISTARTMSTALPVAAGLFAIAFLLVHSGWAFSAVVFLIGATVCLLPASFQKRVIEAAAAAPDLASTLTASAYNAGIAAGAFAGAAVLSAGFGYEAIPLLSVIGTAVATLICWAAVAGPVGHERHATNSRISGRIGGE
jgi:MFS transporter, DHA1 family, inner membrane transport protein